MATINAWGSSYPAGVVSGGTGAASFTAFSIITAGTTATGPFQNVVGVGTSGQILTSGGAGVLPSWITGAASSSASVITDDNATNATMYPVWVTANTGGLPLKVSSTKLSFNPSTAALSTTTLNLTGNINGSNGFYSSAALPTFTLQYIVSAVNYVSVTNNITGNNPIVLANGTDTDITLGVQGQGTGGVDIRGVATNSNAPSGVVGEYLSAIILAGAAVPMTSTVSADITSLALTAGDWDCWAELWTSANGATTTTIVQAAINTVSATLPTVPADGTSNEIHHPVNSAGAIEVISTSPCRISIASPTTIYFVANITFAVNTMATYGKLCARRVR